MKIFKLCLVLFLLAGFSACENHMDIRDITKGTPTRADTVLPHRFSPAKTEAEISAHNEKLPRVFLR
ncbi:MAG: hypothetical protein M3Z26_08450 [Bacteroidota bacterium]|nr:hypothetical protein [Bacteroidota bacterium]